MADSIAKMLAAKARLKSVDAWLAGFNEHGPRVAHEAVTYLYESERQWMPEDMRKRFEVELLCELPDILNRVRASFAKDLREAAQEAKAEVDAIAAESST